MLKRILPCLQSSLRRPTGHGPTKGFNPGNTRTSLRIKDYYKDDASGASGIIGTQMVPQRGVSASLPLQTSGQALKALHAAGVPFLDIRDPAEFERSHVKASHSFDYADIVSGAVLPILPKDPRAVLVVIANTYRGANAAQALYNFGYVNTMTTTYEEAQKGVEE